MLLDKIGRYRIKTELGRGGMSTVYLARDPHFDRDVAIKLLPHELLHFGNFRLRFEREAKIVASLDHPAIVPVHDFGEEKGQPYLVMRFMSGGSLTDRLKQGAMPIQEASRLISRLAPALDEVHAKGILHRDLKPSNILFDQRNAPFISDFGTAKSTFEHTKLTETGGAVGTPAYMSPEQIQGDVALNGRSDIYALGVILFEMVTGQHPYQTNTPIGLAVKHIFEPVPSIRDIRPELPSTCQDIIIKAMAKSPEDRYETACEFADMLAQVAESSDDQIDTVASHRSLAVEKAKPSWMHQFRHKALWVSTFLVIGLFLIIGSGDSLVNGRSSLLAANNPTQTPTVTKPPTNTPPPTSPPTATIVKETISVIKKEEEAVETAVPTPIPTATATPEAEPINLSATVLIDSSIFAEPTLSAVELTILETGDNINILGRSENGNWLYVLNDEAIAGYVFGERVLWDGDFEQLPKVPISANQSPINNCAASDCPALSLDLYPLPGNRCQGDVAYRTVYIQGQGGNGRYTYYWNDEKLTTTVTDGFGFQVSNLDGDPVIGTGKVVSGDGQTIQKELFITDFTCGN